ncbi:GAF sensor signal transduction histidine kinase [Rippkaea orientalis PCC 8801]|uniref:histidine kinase n=1 Tax=Rippkaea orientalis (strain PCC 8801 / RF-1) TaxID=41431 RepID=B7K4X2_RIPO1|nr:MASE1 domain-containing protein [Rippkaea orientalis]ACK66628.1 GAF sensor signal transduction histidine kinase [Rippkaea orientalis PCC 8801]
MTPVRTLWHSNLSKLTLVAIAYWSGGWLGRQSMELTQGTCPLWLPAGIALTALLLYGEQLWLGIFLGDLLLTLTLGGSWGLAIGSAMATTLSAVIGVKLLHWWRFSPKLSKIRDVTALLLLAAIFAPIVHASLETLVRLILGSLEGKTWGQHWWLQWLGDSSSIMVIAPFLLRLKSDRDTLLRRQPKKRLLEGAICGGLLLGLSWMVFIRHGISGTVSSEDFTNTQYLEYLPFPIVVWAAIRFQTWGAVLGSLFVSIGAIAGTLQGTGPFILQTTNLAQATLLLQIFLIIISTTALLLSAAVTERQRVEKQLLDTLERDHLLAEVALRIRHSLDLEQIFQTTVAEIRTLIDSDRVFIGTLQDNGRIEVVAESVAQGYPSLLGGSARDDLLANLPSLFSQGQTFVASDISHLHLSPTVVQYSQRYQIKAALVVPLHLDHQPLGLLVAHHCSGMRHWHKQEVKLLEQLAGQVMIAMGQAQLYQKVQQLNSNLEKQVAERTHQLQEKIEEVQDLYDMKAVFLQAVSHDLRTSIMGLLMLLKNLENRPGESISVSRSILDRMIKSSDRQLTLINALSKDHFSEERPLIINCKTLVLKDVITKIAQNWEPLLIQNQATFTLHIPDNLPLIFADPEQLIQVFEQLLSNAFKHNPPGIDLVFKATFQGGMVHCHLADNGVGMEPQQCDQLFKLYLRSLHDRRRTGIGLGCYQCRQIIEAHGGTIGVNSNPGKGSEVWFTLPIAKSQPSAVS